MARADRGPLLSSVVLVGLATMATGLLVLIGIQAGKLSFNNQNGRPGMRSEDGGSTAVDVEGRSESPAPAKTTAPTSVSTSRPATDGAGETGSSGATKAPGVAPSQGGSTTAPPRPATTTAAPKPSPTPKPSQSTATSRPSPSSAPSPTCTAKDRSGNCKNSGGGASAGSSAPDDSGS